MLQGLKNIFFPKKEETSEEEQQKVYKYWMSAIKRAYKQMPVDMWEVAETRLKAYQERHTILIEDTRPVVNDFRNHYEGSRAYLDQREPSFKVVPAPAYANDENVLKRAKCERVYLERIWIEQECQKAESQKLDSSLIRNVGFTMPVFDLKKWMPAVRYLPARDVRLDPDCGGLMERVSWSAYKEVISLEELKANNPDLSKGDFEKLKKQGASVLTEKENDDVSEEEKPLYAVVTVWHIFAKNDAALREYDKDDEVELPESLADELKLNTKTRYIQIVEGLPKPLRDADRWPFLLDHNEQMITRLQMNKEPEKLYGFTDYQQMERMDALSDEVMGYVAIDAYYAAVRKYAGNPNNTQPSDMSIEDFLNTNKTTYLGDMMGDDGKPLIQRIDAGQGSNQLAPAYELMHDQSKEASGQNELMSDSIADFKDVTAIGVRYQEQKLHQRVNLRLGGPRGYEKSIQEDAVKLLEIAHQLVPRYSSVAVTGAIPEVDEEGIDYEEAERVVELPWEDAKKAIVAGGQLLKLGVDAIVGKELAEFWLTTDDTPMEEIRLSTQVVIVPGSTRTITQEQKAADLQEFFIQQLWPTVYEPMMRFDLAKKFLEHVGMLKGIDRMEDYLPQEEEITQFIQEQKKMQQQQAQAEQQQNQQQAEVEQQKAQTEQVAADADLERDEIRGQMEIEKEVAKAEIDEEKVRIQMTAQRQKAKAPGRKE